MRDPTDRECVAVADGAEIARLSGQYLQRIEDCRKQFPNLFKIMEAGFDEQLVDMGLSNVQRRLVMLFLRENTTEMIELMDLQEEKVAR